MFFKMNHFKMERHPVNIQDVKKGEFLKTMDGEWFFIYGEIKENQIYPIVWACSSRSRVDCQNELTQHFTSDTTAIKMNKNEIKDLLYKMLKNNIIYDFQTNVVKQNL